jgi:hypothetical protein
MWRADDKRPEQCCSRNTHQGSLAKLHKKPVILLAQTLQLLFRSGNLGFQALIDSLQVVLLRHQAVQFLVSLFAQPTRRLPIGNSPAGMGLNLKKLDHSMDVDNIAGLTRTRAFERPWMPLKYRCRRMRSNSKITISSGASGRRWLRWSVMDLRGTAVTVSRTRRRKGNTAFSMPSIQNRHRKRQKK